jgi:hypothetical protein
MSSRQVKHFTRTANTARGLRIDSIDRTIDTKARVIIISGSDDAWCVRKGVGQPNILKGKERG